MVGVDPQSLNVQLITVGPLASGEVKLTFDPPVEHVWVRLRTDEGGEVQLWYQGQKTASRWIARNGGKVQEFEFISNADAVVVRGWWVYWYNVCFLPGWTCVGFEAASFPQDSTGRQTYAGVDFETQGTMSVDGDTLIVTAPVTTKRSRKPRTVSSYPGTARERTPGGVVGQVWIRAEGDFNRAAARLRINGRHRGLRHRAFQPIRIPRSAEQAKVVGGSHLPRSRVGPRTIRTS